MADCEAGVEVKLVTKKRLKCFCESSRPLKGELHMILFVTNPTMLLFVGFLKFVTVFKLHMSMNHK